jgi:F420-non-reducing hydrogenase large subunit
VNHVVITPATRLEGEAKVNIFLDEEGRVEDAFFQAEELKGFEKFCIGRRVEDLPRIVTSICGVCPWPHHIASVKALDMLFGRSPPEPARKIRELGLYASIVDSHTLHFYVMAAADFLLTEANRSEKNVFNLLKKNPELVKDFLKNRKYITQIEEIVGGKTIHPVFGLPGGVSKKITKEERSTIENIGSAWIQYAKNSLEEFEKLFKKELPSLSNIYYSNSYSMGLVDQKEKSAYYDGIVRVVDPTGKEVAKFDGKDYLDFIGEQSFPWSYTKFPYLKNVGWKGLRDGLDSGVYKVGPLARINTSNGFSTELANEAYERMVESLGKPVQASMSYHWARLIEVLHMAERMVEVARDESITSSDVLNLDGVKQNIGVGVVEAPRGTLIHHYEADENMITKVVNIIVPTTMNNPSINIEIKRAAQNLIKGNQVPKEVLNRIEMAFRAYDPCIACSVHSISGGVPLRLLIYDKDRNLVREVKSWC